VAECEECGEEGFGWQRFLETEGLRDRGTERTKRLRDLEN